MKRRKQPSKEDLARVREHAEQKRVEMGLDPDDPTDGMYDWSGPRISVDMDPRRKKGSKG